MAGADPTPWMNSTGATRGQRLLSEVTRALLVVATLSVVSAEPDAGASEVDGSAGDPEVDGSAGAPQACTAAASEMAPKVVPHEARLIDTSELLTRKVDGSCRKNVRR